MPLPRVVARLNKRYTNQFIEPIVRRFAGFAVVTHQGRMSGTAYQTPIFVFPGDRDDLVIVSLTYGPSADWAKNVLHAGGSIESNGAQLAIKSSRVIGRDIAWPHLPVVVRLWLRLLRVTDFMLLQTQLLQ